MKTARWPSSLSHPLAYRVSWVDWVVNLAFGVCVQLLDGPGRVFADDGVRVVFRKLLQIRNQIGAAGVGRYQAGVAK